MRPSGGQGTAPPAASTGGALLGVGRVRHLRLRPARNGFDYPTWFLMLPMRALAERPAELLRRNRRGWVSFHDADHGDGGPDALAWLDGYLQQHGVNDANGEVWLHTLPRIFGLTFKPVSFWHAQRADGSLAAIVAEVNNTFGGRHAYLLQGAELGYGRELAAAKALQVSPFNRIEGGYRFRFMRTDGPRARSVARIEYDDAEGPVLITSVSGALEPLTAPALRRVLWRMPLLTLGVVLRIHWQALRLLWRRVPFVGSDGRVAAAADSTPGLPAMTPSSPPLNLR